MFFFQLSTIPIIWLCSSVVKVLKITDVIDRENKIKLQ
jgi:hypothetical protein